jgi:hypothetical protein
MNIEKALKEFDFQRSRKCCSQDQEKIKQVVNGLGVDNFALRFRGDKIEAIYIYDLHGNSLHIHSTMVVSGKAFTGVTDRNKKPYKTYRYHLPLDKWNRS